MRVAAKNRRWFRFSLRTLLKVVAIVGLVLAYPRMKVVERRWMVQELTSRGALVVTWSKDTGHDPPAILTAAGAEPVQWIELPRKGFGRWDINRIAAAFPEADIMGTERNERPITFWIFFESQVAR